MNPIYNLISLVITVLIWGAIIHWILGFFRMSYHPVVTNVLNFLDRIYEPMLDPIRRNIPPLRLSDGRAIEFSPLILIILLVITRKVAAFILT